MNAAIIETLNKQLLRLDCSNGSDSLSMDFLSALKATIQNYKGAKGVKELRAQLLDMYHLLLECRPRMANLSLDVQKLICFLSGLERLDEEALFERIEELSALKQERRLRIAQNARALLSSDSTLLIHSHSGSVLSLLRSCAEFSVKPRLLIAWQEEQKTKEIIRVLHELELDFHLLPEHSISHVIEEVDLAFFGALTLTASDDFIMGPGSASLASQLRAHNIATYVLISSNKFSFWTERTEAAYREVKYGSLGSLRFEKEVFSHDVVSSQLFTAVVTEYGVLSHHDLYKCFLRLQAEFFAREAVVDARTPLDKSIEARTELVSNI